MNPILILYSCKSGKIFTRSHYCRRFDVAEMQSGMREVQQQATPLIMNHQRTREFRPLHSAGRQGLQTTTDVLLFLDLDKASEYELT